MIALTQLKNNEISHVELDIEKDKNFIIDILLNRVESIPSSYLNFHLTFREAVKIIKWFGENYIIYTEKLGDDERIYFKISDPEMYITIYHYAKKDYWSIVPVFNTRVIKWLKSMKS